MSRYSTVRPPKLATFILVVTVVVTLVASFIFASDPNKTFKVNISSIVDLKDKWTIVSDNEATITLSDVPQGNLTLRYNSCFTASIVYVDNMSVLRTENDESSNIFYTYWVNLDNDGDTVLRIKTQDKEALDTILSQSQTIGTEFDIAKAAMLEFTKYFVFFVFCIIVSIVIISANLYLYFNKKDYNVFNSLYLALFTASCGFCVLTDCQVLSLYFDNNAYFSLINFCSIMFLAPSGLQFIKKFYVKRYKILSYLVYIMYALGLLSLFIASVSEFDLFAFLPVVHGCILVGIIFLVVFTFKEFHNAHKKSVSLIIIAFACLFIGSIFGIISYYLSSDSGDSTLSLTISIFIFIVLLLLAIIIEINDYTIQLEKDRMESIVLAEKNAQASDIAKANLLQGVSHDIRTPMNAIIGFTDLAKKNINEPQIIKEYINKVQSASSVLLNVVDDILDTTRIESGVIKIEPVKTDIVEFFDNISEIVKNNAETNKLHFNYDKIDIKNNNVLLDQKHLQRVTLNISSNAVKYTSAGGTINLIVKELPSEKDGYVRYNINISDDGRGMSQEYLAKIFEPFSRDIDESSNEVQGAGLGMAICKNYVELMNGTIHIDSAKGKGTSVYVDLYLHPTDRTIKSDIKVNYVNALIDKTILIVDDDRSNLEIAKSFLESTGAHVKVTSNATEAHHLVVNDEPYDCILLDIRMPHISGIELTKLIRQNGDSTKASTPIIGLGSDQHEIFSTETITAGMDDYLLKPMTESELLEKVIQIIR